MEQLLARRELDVAWPPATANRIGRFAALDGVDVSVAEPGGTLESLVANTVTLPLDRRLAYLGLANRDRFVDVLLAGEGERAVSLRGRRPVRRPGCGHLGHRRSRARRRPAQRRRRCRRWWPRRRTS